MIDTAGNIVKAMIKASGSTQTQLARLMGYKGQSSVAERLNKDMRVSVFASMAEALGYEIYVVPTARGGNVAFKKDEAFRVRGGKEE